MYFIVYKTTCIINNKIYVGAHKTKNMNDGYIGDGICKQRHAKLNTIFHRAVKKYGYDNFKREIIEFCPSNKHLEQREFFWIEELKSHMSFGGYNMTKGGFGGDTITGHPDYIEICKKLSINSTGHQHTEETKKIIALTSKERWEDPVYKKQISEKIAIKLKGNTNSKGHMHSEEYKHNKSIIMLGNVNGKGNKGKTTSDETKEKQRKAKLGKPSPKKGKHYDKKY